MKSKKKQLSNSEDSFPYFWESLHTYLQSLLMLWQAMELRGLPHSMIINSIIKAVECLHLIISSWMNKNKVTEYPGLKLPTISMIDKIENHLFAIYSFSYPSSSSIYESKKLLFILNTLLNELYLLKELYKNRKKANNPNLKWLAPTIFSNRLDHRNERK